MPTRDSLAKVNFRILLSLIFLPAFILSNEVVTIPSPNSHQPQKNQEQRQKASNKTNDDPNPATNHTRATGSHATHANSAFKVYDTCSLSKTFSLKRFKKGHLIGSHTWSHVHLTQGTRKQIIHQIELIERAMIKILGVKPLLFRPPYGEYDDVVIQVLKERGYKGLVLWSEDSQDSLEAPPSPAQMIQTYQTYPEKTIVLSHETHQFMIDEVNTFHYFSACCARCNPKAKAKGFKLIPVADCLELGTTPNDWYEVVSMPGSRDDSWTCDGTPAPVQRFLNLKIG
ncbi:hypothetical protein KEM48_012589 [Puccinia striiformis f. sp. tritici PST-130]|nr:hypothetical protein KEM48_012589 [Puccinia striiformis f. sp. tritici PST-130]